MSKKPLSSGPQPALVPPEVLEVTLRIGVVGSTDHAQVLVEVRNATDGQLLELESTPHVALDQLDTVVDMYAQQLMARVRRNACPF